MTVPEAAAILGVSTQTVRRMLRRGQLEGERVHRAQGSAYVVKLSAPHTVGDTDATASQQPAPNVTRSKATGQPAGDAIAAMIQATLTPIVGPLVAELAASRQAIARPAEQLVSQAGTRAGSRPRLRRYGPLRRPLRGCGLAGGRWVALIVAGVLLVPR